MEGWLGGSFFPGRPARRDSARGCARDSARVLVRFCSVSARPDLHLSFFCSSSSFAAQILQFYGLRSPSRELFCSNSRPVLRASCWRAGSASCSTSLLVLDCFCCSRLLLACWLPLFSLLVLLSFLLTKLLDCSLGSDCF